MLKEKMKRKEKMVGMYLQLCDSGIAKIVGLSGYDFIWVDTEHSYMSYETLFNHIIALKSTGTPVIVRAPQDDLTATKKILDMGVDGIIFPMVKTAEEANELIASTLYPPYGNRGFGPHNAIDFGFDDVSDYIKNSHNKMARFIQIEHKDAISNLDKIMENEYIDGYIFGPNDLSGSYNLLGNPFDEKITEIITMAIEKLRRKNKYIGIASGGMSEDILAHWGKFDIDMLCAGSDIDLLREASISNRERLKKFYKE